ncbi:MAG TPA: DUF1648 domain-containing protein [Candidatus Eremiobacteraceae bacterium]|nr:DUF1648 domain-containing protein [Candidatus Eremiobacteraceae bacterium]
MTSDKAWSFAIVLLAVAGAIAILAVFAHDYPLSPATVPTHFGVSGAADAFGPRTTFILFPALGGLFAAIAIVVWAFSPQVSSTGKPVPPILPIIVVLIFAETTWMMFFVELGSFSVALGQAASLGSGIFIGVAIVLATSLVLLAVTLLSIRRMV